MLRASKHEASKYICLWKKTHRSSHGPISLLLLCNGCLLQVTKREEESSLMQLKDEFRSYEALRREHDAQIVQIAAEAGLRISPEQWSSLLYGDTAHKSHMQSVIDKVNAGSVWWYKKSSDNYRKT